MLKLLSPQTAQDDAGYIIQIADRNHVEYRENDRRLSVEVEFGGTLLIYAQTLIEWLGPDVDAPITKAERKKILARIAAGLAAMGSTPEII